MKRGLRRPLFAPALLFATLGAVSASGISAQVRAPGGQASQMRFPWSDADLRRDPRVRAFARAYAPLIDSVTYGVEDVVFTLGGRRFHFQGGRMLDERRLEGREHCDPIFYHYALGALTEPAAPEDDPPHYCTDVMEGIWGRTEGQIRRHGRSTTFLEHRVFVNDFVVDALSAVEEDLLRAATGDGEVAGWIDELDITFSFIYRGIAGSSTRSQHAWGLAIDLVPDSYGGKQVYWRWSRVFDREGWHRIPLERRWSPPQAVIGIFERHGFVWGGKWAHFDTIHFEYRPEIILYNQLVSDG